MRWRKRRRHSSSNCWRGSVGQRSSILNCTRTDNV
jgi:hypothetical protein